MELVIFDLDGVLVDTRDIHYRALNRALAEVGDQYVINEMEHVSCYDGRPTRVKLNMLSESKGLPLEQHDQIWKSKQEWTREMLMTELKPTPKLVAVLNYLKFDCHLQLYCATNSVRETVHAILEQMEIRHLFDRIYCNEDVVNPKPNPEMYLKAISDSKYKPDQILICEDSPIGLAAARQTECRVCPIQDPHDILEPSFFQPWLQSLNIVVPMAGAGSRFRDAGYSIIKPLIPVQLNHGACVFSKPMIEVVMENVPLSGRVWFLSQQAHILEYDLGSLLPKVVGPNQSAEIVSINGLTQGAAETVLLAMKHIELSGLSSLNLTRYESSPLLIVNSDQFLEWNPFSFLSQLFNSGVDGGILCFQPGDESKKWSYVRTESKDDLVLHSGPGRAKPPAGLVRVVEVKEKQVIGPWATCGVYYWRRGSDFVKYANRMILANKRVNNEFYVCPVYQEAIEDGLDIRALLCTNMYGLGTPEDLNWFETHYDHP